MANTVLKTANSRVFLLEGRAGPATAPSYESFFRMTGISQGFGDIERVEAPDPYNYGKFIEIAQIRGASERVTTSLEGRYYMDLLSTMLKLADRGCSFDVHLHLGACGDPSDFETFTKSVVFEDALITNYGTDDLGALSSDENAVVNETVDISASRVYEIRPISFSTKAGTAITNEVVDIEIIDSRACAGDECGEVSDGCSMVWALTKSAGGSPSTPADVVLIHDSIVVARDIDTLGAAEEPTALAGVGNYIVVLSNASSSYHYALRSEFREGVVPTWTEVAIAAKPPNGIYSLGNIAYICGDDGYVWQMNSPSGELIALEAGNLTAEDLNDIFALDTNYIVAVGDAGSVVHSSNGQDFALAAAPSSDNITCVWMASRSVWWVGTDGGELYYTTNSGVTWEQKSFIGSGTGVVQDIDFATGSVGYLSHTTAGGAGRLLRTYNGGYTWVVLPEGSGTIPANQRLNRLATCQYDANQVYAGGLGADTDGIVIAGTAG